LDEFRERRRRTLRAARETPDRHAAAFVARFTRRLSRNVIDLNRPPLRAEEFAPGEGIVYLNHAAAGLLPRRARNAVLEFVDGQMERGVLGVLPVEMHLERFRERVGAFIGASGDEISFLRNTGDGANVLARGLDWRPGDEIVLCANEFGANAMPWLALRELGVVVRFIDAPARRMTPELLEATMSERTRLVAVSWVSFVDGYRHDLAALSATAHARGALFCVDAIQALGAFPLDVKREGIDALYAGGAKWLLAVAGVSFLYVSPELRERLHVRWRGWRDVADIWNFLDYDQPLAANGARFEGGTLNYLGIAALEASIGLIAEAGTEAIAAHVLGLTDRLVAGLQSLGAAILGDRSDGHASGIVTFTLEGSDPVALGRALGRAGIVTTFRTTGIRVSPHGHNTAAHIDALLSGVAEAKAKAPA
jgi:cysteine desulfurase/selenocysteine lyase